MALPALVAAELATTADGTPFAPRYGDVYHAAQGGLEQARHVFLAGNDLPARWAGAERFVILETGFGLGLNFLATWQAWRESAAGGRLHFISTELHPFRRDDLARLLAAYPGLADPAAELLRQWPPPVPGCQRLHFDHGRVTLTLLLGAAQDLLPQLAASLDAVYLDGFAPAKNPDLWSPGLLATITRLCRPGSTLATWSVAGDLRHTLQSLGWTLERRPGFAAKREMLHGVRDAVACPRSGVPGMQSTPEPSFSGAHPARARSAIVVGAGLAGTAIAERLASRGWQVQLFERHAAPAQEASGNPAGIVLPHLAKDDAIAARLSRACYLYALRRFAVLPGIRWSPCGVLQVARDAAHEALQRATVADLGLPPDFAAFLERDAASTRIGHPVAHGGWWFPAGGWVAPGSVCAALLRSAGAGVHPHFGVEVASLRPTADDWQVLDASGSVLAAAGHLILANAHAANRLLRHPLPLTPIRGQVSYLPPEFAPGMEPPLRHVVCRAGYVTPPAAGTVCVGASFDSGDSDPALRLADHAGNLRRLDDLLPGSARGIDPTRLDGRVGLRTAAPDRLPLVGTLPDTAAAGAAPSLEKLPRIAGLHALLGLSARGMVWAPLAAELLASQLEGEPCPVERDVARAIDPARFHLRAVRRQGTAEAR